MLGLIVCIIRTTCTEVHHHRLTGADGQVYEDGLVVPRVMFDAAAAAFEDLITPSADEILR